VYFPSPGRRLVNRRWTLSSCCTNQIYSECGFKMCECNHKANDYSRCENKHAIAMSIIIVHLSACFLFIYLDMWRKLWRKHLCVFLWICESKETQCRLKSVAVNKIAGNDRHTTYAGMSQIYAHIYASRRCAKFRE